MQRRLGAAAAQELVDALLVVGRKIGKVEVLRFDAVDFEIDLDRTYFDVPVRRPILDAD